MKPSSVGLWCMGVAPPPPGPGAPATGRVTAPSTIGHAQAAPRGPLGVCDEPWMRWLCSSPSQSEAQTVSQTRPGLTPLHIVTQMHVGGTASVRCSGPPPRVHCPRSVSMCHHCCTVTLEVCRRHTHVTLQACPGHVTQAATTAQGYASDVTGSAVPYPMWLEGHAVRVCF